MRLSILSLIAATVLLQALPAAEFNAGSLQEETKVMLTKLDKVTVESAKAFITAYADPEDVEKLTKQGEGSLDPVAKKFVEQEKGANLVQALKALDFTTAKVDDKEQTITVSGTEDKAAGGQDAGGMSPGMTFHFVGGHWYLRN